MEEIFKTKKDVDDFLRVGGSLDDLEFFSETVTSKTILNYIKEKLNAKKKRKP